MKSVMIFGISRSGTTLLMDLIAQAGGYIQLDETPFDIVEKVDKCGLKYIWKSPHNCLDMNKLCEKFPNVRPVQIIRDGRDNLCGYIDYVLNYRIDPSFEPYLGLKGFANLWNEFAQQTIHSKNFFIRLEDLTVDSSLIHRLSEYLELDDPFHLINYQSKWITKLRNNRYPCKANRLGDLDRWRHKLLPEQIDLIDKTLLEQLGYVC